MDFLHASVTFAWPRFGLMLLGMALASVVGLLPGLGGPTTLALTLPFVFRMTPIEAFAFLLGSFPWVITTASLILASVHTIRDLTDRRGAVAKPEALDAGSAPNSIGEGRISIGLSLAAFAFVYLLFEKALSVPFPPGQLFVWLGHGG